MLTFLRHSYEAFVFYFNCNKKITLSSSTSLRPSLHTYYTGKNIHGYRITLPNQENNELIMKPGPIIEMVLVKEGNTIESPEKGKLYVFGPTNGSINRTISEQKKIFNDPAILKVVADISVHTFIMEYIKRKDCGLYLTIQDVETWMKTVWISILFGIVLFLTMKACKTLIRRLSKLDPMLSDFNIVSSDLVKFKDLTVKEMAQCSICFEEFVPEEDVRILDCKHYFHPKCIDRWLIGHSKRCPCCRGSIVINEKV